MTMEMKIEIITMMVVTKLIKIMVIMMTICATVTAMVKI